MVRLQATADCGIAGGVVVKAEKTNHLIDSLLEILEVVAESIPNGSKYHLKTKSVLDAHYLASKSELDRLEQIAAQYEADKKYIALGKAVEKAYNLDGAEFISIKGFEGENVKFFHSLEHLLEWAEGRE